MFEIITLLGSLLNCLFICQVIPRPKGIEGTLLLLPV